MNIGASGRLSPRSKMGAKWLSKIKKTSQISHKDSVAVSVLHLSPLGSQLSFSNVMRIDNVVDWDVVRKKYRALFGEKVPVVEKPADEEKEEPADSDPLAAFERPSTPTYVSGKDTNPLLKY